MERRTRGEGRGEERVSGDRGEERVSERRTGSSVSGDRRQEERRREKEIEEGRESRNTKRSVNNDAQRFWKLILEDHLHFVVEALDKSHGDIIRRVIKLSQSQDSDLLAFLDQVIELKKDLLYEKLTNPNFKIDLPPTFLNHMLNEADQAKKELNGEISSKLSLGQIWLLDAEGHEITIKCKLDPVEKFLKKELKKNCNNFGKLFCRTLEFIGYLRANVDNFGALTQLDEDVQIELTTYFELVSLIADKMQDGTVLTTIHPLMIDHMLREQSYYALKCGYTNIPGTVNPFMRGVELPPPPPEYM